MSKGAPEEVQNVNITGGKVELSANKVEVKKIEEGVSIVGEPAVKVGKPEVKLIEEPAVKLTGEPAVKVGKPEVKLIEEPAVKVTGEPAVKVGKPEVKLIEEPVVKIGKPEVKVIEEPVKLTRGKATSAKAGPSETLKIEAPELAGGGEVTSLYLRAIAKELLSSTEGIIIEWTLSSVNGGTNIKGALLLSGAIGSSDLMEITRPGWTVSALSKAKLEIVVPAKAVVFAILTVAP